MNESIGDFMTEGRQRAIKTIAIVGGIFVYLGALLYGASHNWNLLVNGVLPELRMWAAVGVVALELSGVFLPLSIHFWTHEPLHRIAAMVFYVLTLLLIAANMVVDYAGVTGAILPAWLGSYRLFVVPAIPILCGAGWSLLFLLDPSSKEIALVEGLRASTKAVLARRIANAARTAQLDKQVDAAAATMTADIIAAVLGASVARVAPHGVIEGKARDPQPGNGKVVFNAEAETERPKAG